MGDEVRLPGPDNTWVFLGERKDGSQVLIHIYNPADAELSERPNSSDVWGIPISLEKR